jgi:NTE family protein
VGKKGLALVLSGGAARCIAQLGFLQLMDQEGIRPAVISGVSGGAIVGAFYCNGYTPKEIIKVVKNTSMFTIFSPAWGAGLIKMDRVEKVFNDYLGTQKFEKLNIPLIISACDIDKAEMVSFSSGELIQPLLGSCAVPPLIKPVEVNGRKLADGGILNNLPVEPVKDFDKILGINVNVLNTAASIQSMALYAERVVDILVIQNISESKKQCTLFLEAPEMKYFHLTDVGKADEMFAIGYEYAKKNLKHLHALMKD